LPDHVHLFVRGDHSFVLSTWVGGLKRAMSVAMAKRWLWQPGFFDHALRSSESYAEKRNNVRENPVRAGLVDYAAKLAIPGRNRGNRSSVTIVAAGMSPACIGELQPARLPLQKLSINTLHAIQRLERLESP